ncbi:hypothetical protein LguiA_035036 [Lonicera macranthoides]
MPTLKLTTIASLSARPQNLHEWPRTTASATTTSGGIQEAPMISCRGWRITSCAPPAHDNTSPRKLGFRRHKCFSYSEYRGGESPQPSEQQQSSKFLTLPTVLTIGRVAAVPLLVSSTPFAFLVLWGGNAATSIFIAASITDWLDGYIAREMNLGSAFGAFLDPVADKLMVAATLVLLCTRPPEFGMFVQLPWLLTVPSIAIIGREITMSAVREWAASQNGELSEAVAVNNLGKWKTATQMTALTILLATRNSSLTGSGVLATSGVALLYISAWLALWSLFVYMQKIWNVLLA